MSVATPPASTEFFYDALRKVAVARGTAADGQAWTLEFRSRHDDDSMNVVLREPSGKERVLTVTDADFAFGESSVTLAPVPALTLTMQPLYVKKLRGFTRGNIPTPDVPGPSLP
jgi:hypothetical protein